MNEDRLERLVRAAVSGIMEAVLATEVEQTSPAPMPVFTPPPKEAIEFPSVSRIEEEIFGETPPQTMRGLSNEAMAASKAQKQDLDRALETIAKVRAQRDQDECPDVQPGPGEKDVAEWLRVQQT